MSDKFRSGCPIACTLDLIGDKWSLLIIRDMLLHHKLSFKDFSVSEEHIAPSILSSRLKLLSNYGLITKQKLASNKKENIYLLSEKALELAFFHENYEPFLLFLICNNLRKKPFYETHK